MRIDVLTLFPEMFEGVFGASILGKARDKGLVRLQTVNFRQYSTNKHNTVDDYPYGGGGGMVLKPDPIFAAIDDLLGRGGEQDRDEGAEAGLAETAEAALLGQHFAGEMYPHADKTSDEPTVQQERNSSSKLSPRVILLCPQGEPFSQRKAEELAAEEHLVFICGHYEGYDERIREHLVTDELSIGDYVLTGGELPAMVIIDSVVRLLPGVLGNESSAVTDSFSTGLLEYPHYTRPAVFRGHAVPDVLISGHHANVDAWRREESLRRTWQRRPDLLAQAALTDKERAMLREWDRTSRQAEADGPTEE